MGWGGGVVGGFQTARPQALQVIAEAVAELQQIAEWDVKALALTRLTLHWLGTLVGGPPEE